MDDPPDITIRDREREFNPKAVLPEISRRVIGPS